MKTCARVFVLAVSSLLLAGSVDADVILQANFEPPTYALGNVHGQDGWSTIIGSPHQVSTSIVHSGSQALNSVGAKKDFTAPFVTLGSTWFVEGYCYTQPGSYSSHFGIGNDLNEHFWIELRADGQLTFYSTSTIDVRMLGAVALNKWLHFKVEYIAHPYFIRMTVAGDGVNETKEWGFIAAGQPSFLHIGTTPAVNLPDGAGPYWDDILVANEHPLRTSTSTWGAIKALYR